MSNEWMTHKEKSELEKTMEKLNDIRSFLNAVKTENRDGIDVYETFNVYKRFKEKVSNYNSDMAYISCLMAKEWLINKFGGKIDVSKKIDVSEKPQAANGFDIDVNMDAGRIIAEIKNTVPCKKDGGFGAQQMKSINDDLKKLEGEKTAEYKFFFVTDPRCYEILNGENYKIEEIELVLLSR